MLTKFSDPPRKDIPMLIVLAGFLVLYGAYSQAAGFRFIV